MQLVFAVLALAVVWHLLDQILLLKRSWGNLRKAFASTDAGQHQVARQAVGYWVFNLALALLAVLAIVLVATGHDPRPLP